MVIHPVMEWLAAGVPLSLLMDLAGNDDPDSEEIMHAETGRRTYARTRVGAGRVTEAVRAL